MKKHYLKISKKDLKPFLKPFVNYRSFYQDIIYFMSNCLKIFHHKEYFLVYVYNGSYYLEDIPTIRKWLEKNKIHYSNSIQTTMFTTGYIIEIFS